MNKRLRDIVKQAGRLGFTLDGIDSIGRHVLRHTDGTTYTMPPEFQQHTWERSVLADLRRLTGVSAPVTKKRPRHIPAKEFTPAASRTESISARYETHARTHRSLCETIRNAQGEWFDPESEFIRTTMASLHETESAIRHLGRAVPLRSFRSWAGIETNGSVQ